jgi:hypothetical protein
VCLSVVMNPRSEEVPAHWELLQHGKKKIIHYIKFAYISVTTTCSYTRLQLR